MIVVPHLLLPSQPASVTPIGHNAVTTRPTPHTRSLDHAPRWVVLQRKKSRDEPKVKANAARAFDLSFYPEGSPRQLAAIYASCRRTEGLQQLDVPTLVIHGRDDELISPDGGFRTAELIPGAHLLFVADMGHDMPEPLWPMLVDAVPRLSLLHL